MMMNPSGMFIWSMRVVLIYSFEQRAIFDEIFFLNAKSGATWRTELKHAIT